MNKELSYHKVSQRLEADPIELPSNTVDTWMNKRKKFKRISITMRLPSDIHKKLMLFCKRRNLYPYAVVSYCIERQLSYNLTELVYYSRQAELLKDFYILSGCERERQTTYYENKKGTGGGYTYYHNKPIWGHCKDTRYQFKEFLEMLWKEARVSKKLYKKLKLTQAQLMYGVKDD